MGNRSNFPKGMTKEGLMKHGKHKKGNKEYKEMEGMKKEHKAICGMTGKAKREAMMKMCKE